MPFYEIIFETGAHSVAFYEDDNEAKQAVQAAHERAVSGGRSMSDGNESGPAERVTKVLVYDEHPATLNEEQTLSADVAEKMVKDAVKRSSEDGVISVPVLAAAVRDFTNPMVEESGPHDSNFKMKEAKELKWQ